MGGEVSIDTSKVSGDPQATIRKAQIVYRAAMAPAEPSGQDRSIASQAKSMEMEARRELSQQKIEVAGSGTGSSKQTETQEGVAQAPGTGAAQEADDGADAGQLLDLLG